MFPRHQEPNLELFFLPYCDSCQKTKKSFQWWFSEAEEFISHLIFLPDCGWNPGRNKRGNNVWQMSVRWCQRDQDLAFPAGAAAGGREVWFGRWWCGWGCWRQQQIKERFALASSSTGTTGSKISAWWVGKDKTSRERDAIFKFLKVLKQILKLLGNMPPTSEFWSCLKP